MDQITSRLIAKLDKRTVALQHVGVIFEVTTGGDLDVGTRLGKRRALSAN